MRNLSQYRFYATIAACVALAGCATRPPPKPVAVAPQPTQLAIVHPPAGAAPNLDIPDRRADGSYPTPNEGLTPAAAIWHLRVAMNVAALSCRGGSEALIVSGYNQLIKVRKTALAEAERTLIAQHRGTGPATDRSGYDSAMTRLYNYFAQPPAQADFCAAAAPLVAEATVTPAASFGAFAARAVAQLDRPFTDFYRAYDAYRDARLAQQTAVYVRARAPGIVRAAPPAQRAPQIAIDPAVFKGP